jgi:ATP-dependent Clp protease, protease subunit
MSCTPRLHAPAFTGSATFTPYPQSDVYERLLRERIVLLGAEVTDELANEVNAKLLLLDADDHTKDISLYINSPGGSVYAGMAIFDTMNMVRADVATICMGMAASMGQFLLCAGAKGKRTSLPHSRILMHQPLGQMQGRASDIQIHAEQMLKTKQQMAEIIARLTGQTVERVAEDSDHDRWFTPQEALDYGMIDRIVGAEQGRG